MWKKLNLEYFKCFEKLSLPLSNLTLLSGVNSSGKSTILQALALLNQTCLDNEWSQNLLLNGSIISLGVVGDVIDKKKGSRHQATIGIETDDYKCTWKVASEDRSSFFIPFKEITLLDFETNQEQRCDVTSQDMILYRMLPKSFSVKFSLSDFTDKIYKLTFICADRLGPQESYKAPVSAKYCTVGAHGEYTPWYLIEHGDKRVSEPLRIHGETITLQRQTEAYFRQFFPGAGFRLDRVTGTNQVTLSIETYEGGIYHKPQNVGYGLTQILPILTACLNASKEDVILIENPESNLHPAAQANMGLFLSKVAATGIQIILETHSDHILNGIRRAVKDKNYRLTKDQVAVHFFRLREKAEAENLAQVQSLLIDKEGNLDDWPKDFFDQFDKDSEYFAGWKF